MVISSKSHAFADTNRGHSRLFSDMVAGLEALPSLARGGVRLPVPTCMTAGADPLDKKCKEFCVGLLEDPGNHIWSDHLRKGRISRDDWFSVAGSLFLFRKALPVAPSCPSEQRARITSKPPPVKDEYFDFLETLVDDLFRPGWDEGYVDSVLTAVPNVSSCLESSKGKGGCRKQWLNRRPEFVSKCFGITNQRLVDPNVRYCNVETSGKSRGVTVQSSDNFLLSPLHKTIYDHLSRFDWLLRGEAKPGRFAKFVRKPNEVFVSGDYSSATDNLSLECAEVLLKRILKNSRTIPFVVQRDAIHSLRANVWYDDHSVPFVQTRGQLMGNFLSFPLLCLQNYAAFRWILPHVQCVKINGDDIAFRASREDAQKWKDFCPTVGLIVHPTKTMIDGKYFSLNSAFFRAGTKKISLIPTFRFGCLGKPLDSPTALAGRLSAFVRGFPLQTKQVGEIAFLRYYRKAIQKSGRSLMALRIHASVDAIKGAGLWRRELWYSQLSTLDDRNLEKPLPVNPGKVEWGPVPEGWKRVPLSRSSSGRRQQRLQQDEFFMGLSSVAWSRAPEIRRVERDHWKECAGTGQEETYLKWFETAKKPKSFLLCSHHSARICFGWRYLKVGDRLRRWLWEPPPRTRLIWSARDREGEVRFVSAG